MDFLLLSVPPTFRTAHFPYRPLMILIDSLSEVLIHPFLNLLRWAIQYTGSPRKHETTICRSRESEINQGDSTVHILEGSE